MRRLDRLGGPRKPFAPTWSDTPIARGHERSNAPTGWPRETDSLCPDCVRETQAQIRSGDVDWRSLVRGRPAEIPARIAQRGGRIVMEKTCPRHGRFEDVLSIDPAFHARMEHLAPSRDVRISPDGLHDHGSSSMKYGRGGVLTVDLTNRCNMMCNTCFMDANQTGHVYELSWEETKRILDDAMKVRPRRQMSVQFSGGEPTLSPHFLDAIRYARKLGFFCVQCATNGLRFALEPDFARQCKEAGLRLVYFQFDGVTNEAHGHRNVGNLHDVKLRAIEQLAAAGIDIVLVATVIRGVNDDQVGPIVQFAVDNADKLTVVSFQPISFTGRDEDVSDDVRRSQRYTLSHLVHDVHAQTGWTDPLRDWFPLSALAPFGDVVDMLDGPAQPWGHLKCACHPHCGTGTILFVNKRSGEMVPLVDFLDVEGLLADLVTIFDSGRSGLWAKAQLAASLMRHYKPAGAPAGFSLATALRQFMSQTGAAHAGEDDAADYDWRVLFVAGMWFQDLYNYDFRRTEMCIIPHGTPHGEISFCALNTGVGWRQIVERDNAKATTADWYREHGRHEIHAGGRDLELPDPDRPPTIKEHPLTIRERVALTAQTIRGGNGQRKRTTGGNGKRATGGNGQRKRGGNGKQTAAATPRKRRPQGGNGQRNRAR
ncbi:MAG: radical SAM protein [Deltaproteobacteria bacterium]|nr:radical SAM protein [Deltaproteobacteria bacterium]MBW2534199.1 radical SAM protein [Deltaproteobacteria bacterium]